MCKREGWYFLAVKKLSALLHGITLKHEGGLNYLHSFITENKLKSHEKVCQNKDLCGTVMSSQKDNINNLFWKKKKMPSLKKRTKITSRCNSM